MLYESEPLPEQQYQRMEARQWRVGDLISHREYGRCLLIMADHWPEWVRFISESGDIFDMSEPGRFSHNTGLQCTYKDQHIAERDFRQGVFTPYFEIL